LLPKTFRTEQGAVPDHSIVLGALALDPATQTLTHGGGQIVLGQKGALLLAAMLRRPGEIVTKRELMDAGWGQAAIEESNLSVQIAQLRRALEPAVGSEAIVTVPRIGYRLVLASTARPASAAASIAVLPFANLDPDPNQQYFADGLAEELITALSKLSGLVVIARNSSFAYRGQTDARRIAAELEVDHLLEGSIRRSANRLRMAVQLVDGSTGTQIWAERYDRELTDVFAIQDDVTGHVVEAMRVHLLPNESATRQRRGTTNLEALTAYAHARALFGGARLNLEVLERGQGLLREAIAADPHYAEAHAELAWSTVLDYVNRWSPQSQDLLPEARRLADRAIALDPEAAHAWSASALVAMMEHDVARFRRDNETSLRLNPNLAMGHGFRGNLAVAEGDPAAAIKHWQLAMRLEPAAHQIQIHHLGHAYLLAGELETAVALFRERILMVPDTDMTRGLLVAALGHLGRIEEAQRVWTELMAISPNYSLRDRLTKGLPYSNPAHPAFLLDGLRKAGVPVV
jgi:TolB-like protein